MLLLTRREGESIIIGDGIQIQVLSVSEVTGEVTLSIDAPVIVAVQCIDLSSEATGCKAAPVITNKRRWRSLLTK
ncbi:carbon storage regulator [Pseudomonas syringae]|uniref:carbon storage regulator n=1 Tax=Pseudomonas syringae TaxID=317 RepID=UPI001F31DF3C|nr:carbon storage regulator [Pseudomonas syringae]MCF5382000.1 carbon storage regulator [Pseudomonas syringae]MCF5419467.1 carbon storage regulator [Pseudomonas syringae]MCF5452013.1 carbon storage regulator [Pseudomonas syringae]MCF5456300.1 carbon storage regulator [Pseudomonas syringae]